MSRILILLSIISFTFCLINSKRPTYNEKKLIDCLKEDKIEYNDKVKELREYYDAERMHLYYKVFYSSGMPEYMKYQMMYCFGEYGLKLKKVSNYLNCMDKCKDNPNKKCKCRK